MSTVTRMRFVVWSLSAGHAVEFFATRAEADARARWLNEHRPGTAYEVRPI